MTKRKGKGCRLKMSEKVKIGGIGKNPAIDKINSLNVMDVKNYAAKKMEELLLVKNSPGEENSIFTAKLPLDFSQADWKGKTDGEL